MLLHDRLPSPPASGYTLATGKAHGTGIWIDVIRASAVRDRGPGAVREIPYNEPAMARRSQAPCPPVTIPELPGSDRSRHSRLLPLVGNCSDQILAELIPAVQSRFRECPCHAKHPALPGRFENEFAIGHGRLSSAAQLGAHNSATPIMASRVTRAANSSSLVFSLSRRRFRQHHVADVNSRSRRRSRQTA